MSTRLSHWACSYSAFEDGTPTARGLVVSSIGRMRLASSFWTTLFAALALSAFGGCDSTSSEGADAGPADESASDGSLLASDVTGSEPARREGELSDAEIVMRPAT